VWLANLEPLLRNGPWACVLVVCAPIAAIVIMFIFALCLVEKSKRVEAIKAMADLVCALRPGKRNQLP
jgi:hypothetical protein